ncbi:TlpA disulfide reductase family protein [Herbaspirillum sp. RTI4]|uniref:TlpA disulfide reductase family protein n=1 Tax=Herbaspirillum sp. RTI4 TaxID=3048640 RepID=UPI002AB4646E|nr:TlpA disulfide reductase family protein [Herbaspirillum sp. RTI4]MDY7577449.1 TlpA disulfide reductase family protein [Herbaspirillum sp. RTI4]MEA9981725.1 TlpA disulfide reductase family protein [Herbaspirillum sp. RTI4]
MDSPTTVVAVSRNRLWIKLACAMVATALAVFAYSTMSGHKAAPDVSFVQLDGQKLALKDLRGKVVMVNFWATSCTTCVGEMPKMVETYNKYKDQGLDFVAVAMSYDPPNYVLNYAQTRKLPFRVALDSTDQLANAFGDVKLTPTTFLIDKQGRIIRKFVGEPEFAQLHQLIEKELAA